MTIEIVPALWTVKDSEDPVGLAEIVHIPSVGVWRVTAVGGQYRKDFPAENEAVAAARKVGQLLHKSLVRNAQAEDLRLEALALLTDES